MLQVSTSENVRSLDELHVIKMSDNASTYFIRLVPLLSFILGGIAIENQFLVLQYPKSHPTPLQFTSVQEARQAGAFVIVSILTTNYKQSDDLILFSLFTSTMDNSCLHWSTSLW